MRLKTISFTCLLLAGLGQLTGIATEVPANLVGVAKFPSPKVFTDKVMSVARVIQPGQQTEMLPLFLLGGFGYPNYPGISETDNVSVFFLDSGSVQPSIVILGKVGEESPLRQTLQTMQWAMEDRDGWLLLSQDPKAFKLIENLDALVAINAEKADFDVTARFYLGKENVKQWAWQFKQMIAEAYTPTSDDESKPLEIAKQQRFVDLAAQMAENLNWFEIGIDLSAETITIGSGAEAIANTPEGILFSSSAGGDIPVGKLISSDGMMSYQSAISVDAIMAYNDVLVERASKMTGEKGKAWLVEYAKMMKDYAKMSDGTSAGRMGFSEDLPEVAAVYGGKFTNKAVLDMSSIAYNKLAPELFENVSLFKDLGMDYTFTLNKEAGKVGDIRVYSLTTVIKMDPEDPTVPGVVPEMTEQEQVSYFAVVNEMLISTASMSEMKKLVANVQAGEPVAKNVASQFKAEKGAAFQYVINMADYASFGLDAAAEASPEMKEWADAMNKLKEANLAPATGAITVGDNRLKSSLSLSVPSIAKVAQVVQEIQAKQAMEQMKQQQEQEATEQPASSEPM
ncbi:hypothetical protein [Rubellicoccus peritrichatus]|uniref:DUF4836 family protein n=1 Tax=Rubellicoccus peritrichatus TaxID=3080537 RepID=A0AAQ3L9Q0_9BACT|nr:hypothetical protein [Puniceicoccus sp. CR14]WOO39448.1 hypothetical protein RZN69_12560 [Puniceicoccus sp. CR14]